MKLFTWADGRQGTGYKTMYFVHSKIMRLDICLISVKKGIEIPSQYDTVPDGCALYRFNVELKIPKLGGIFVGKKIWSIGRRIYYFCPSKEKHSVSKVEEGSLLIFSIGKICG